MAVRLPHFSPKQIADALQVSESSIKRWCDRGDIPTIRTLGGHRRITIEGLQQFLRDTDRVLVNPDVLGLPSLAPGRDDRIPGEQDPNQCEFRCALVAGDFEKCWKLLENRIETGVSRWQAAESLITDAMYGIGEAWGCNELDVYQERRACDLCIKLIVRLVEQIAAPSKGAPVAIGGAPEGDHYQLPTALVKLALREAGWKAINLGSNLPLDSFLQAAHDYKAELVWMSISAIQEPERFIAEENRLARLLGDHVSLFIGGQALSVSFRARLRYTVCCESLRQIVDFSTITRSSSPHERVVR
ncbi:B12 binding domain protein [Novipirellula aureliae]|uniref:B12 binding domain protein n=1 Tax=Novipirellula aureliae TaxID=2527966 RepID=A0A5C6DWV3_9BACT|nr:helix-turn-helix domain-containing protein [Novipirellula aureliae]TWU40377.1 B12 binding domain protein [Novipirellula aureliae]